MYVLAFIYLIRTFAEVISTVAAVISDDIQWILVLCTIAGVTLLGLSIGKDSQLQVFSLPGLKVNNPSQTYMTSVQDAADGRIFLTASDTCLHELEYEKEKGWFSSRQCRLSNRSTGGYYNILGDKAKCECALVGEMMSCG
jgi:hypothetical protein